MKILDLRDLLLLKITISGGMTTQTTPMAATIMLDLLGLCCLGFLASFCAGSGVMPSFAANRANSFSSSFNRLGSRKIGEAGARVVTSLTAFSAFVHVYIVAWFRVVATVYF